jgi:hypothetical protein
MFNRRMFVALAACLAISASTAFAGGNGGTKKDSTVTVANNSGGPIAAFVGVNPNVAATATTQAQVEALGSRIIQSGGTWDFKVKAGNQPLVIADVSAGVPPFPVLKNTTVTAIKGTPVTVQAVGP